MLRSFCSASQPLNKDEALNKDAFRATRCVGFTLIELLVVVLIIGILSAIALPQYERAIWRSRGAQLRILVQALADAQTVYFLANGKYATKFSELDINFPGENTSSGIGATSSNDSRLNNEYSQLLVNVSSSFAASSAVFTKGPYKDCAISYPHDYPETEINQKYVCGVGSTNNSCCWEIFGTSKIPISRSHGTIYYELP
ncbi:MAG: prepilin-type N-terminal cleavage/methylation domain-containing protein [Elusimicrobiaceae bacterium]|nr:prepilin-type N-terminal cleavage/methylation domain-containing protein [Elusimicrobiaceae bacterium]